MKLLNELNFFEENNKKYISNQNIIKFSLLAILLALILLFVGLNFKINDLQTSLNDLMETRLEIANSNIEEPDNSISETDSTDLLELKRDSVTNIQSINSYRNVNSNILEHIKNAIPVNLFLNDMILNEDGITITGYAKSLNLIASFQSNLNNDNLFTDVFVGNITNDLGNYVFTLTAKTEN